MEGWKDGMMERPAIAGRLALATSALAMLLGALAQAACAAGPPPVAAVDPPEHGFFAKRVDYQGIPIKAHAQVSDDALVEAWRRLDNLLGRMPDAVANLRDARVELHVIGKDQVTSDLPEHRHLKGKPFDGDRTVDERTRGLGGRFASCGEENLLRLPNDRYRGRDICSHEFAHTLLSYGLPAEVRARIQAQYERSTAAGLWKNAYASKNVHEYLAELTMWFVGTRGDMGMPDPKPKPGPDGLRAYDPEGYALLADLYGGRIAVARLALAPLEALPAEREPHLKSADGPSTAIRLRNDRAEPVRVFWLDRQGRRKHYADVAAGATWDQDTFATHVWLVTDAAGRGLAAFIARPETGLGVIEPRDPAPPAAEKETSP